MTKDLRAEVLVIVSDAWEERLGLTAATDIILSLIHRERKAAGEMVVKETEKEAKNWMTSDVICEEHSAYAEGCGWCQGRSDELIETTVAKRVLAAARSALSKVNEV